MSLLHQQFAQRRKALPIILILVLVATVSGCASVLERQVHAKSEAVAYRATPNLDNALKYAYAQREQYYEGIVDQTLLSTRNGAILITLAGIGAFYSATSASEDVIIGIATASGALFAGSNYLKSRPVQLVYAAGADALTCGIRIIEPYSYLKAELTDATLEEIQRSIDDADRLILALSADVSSATEAAQMQSLRDEASALLDEAIIAKLFKENAAVRMHAFIEQTRNAVNSAVVESEPDLASLANGLASSLPELGKTITGLKFGVVPPEGDQVISEGTSLIGELRNKYKGVKLSLESGISRLRLYLRQVNALPNDDVDSCLTDIAAAGVLFTVEPSGPVTLSTTPGANTLILNVIGGNLPYTASWTGLPPGDVSRDIRYEGNVATMTLTAGAAAKPGEYTLTVRDQHLRRKTVTVRVTDKAQAQPEGGNASQPSGGTPEGGQQPIAQPCANSSNVREVQEKLRRAGVTNVTVDGTQREVATDGCYGPITEAAIRRLVTEQGEPDATFSVDNLDTITNLLDSIIGPEQ